MTVVGSVKLLRGLEFESLFVYFVSDFNKIIING